MCSAFVIYNHAPDIMTAHTLIERIAAIVGPQGLITDPRDMEPYVVDWRGYHRGVTPAVIRPANAAQVAAVVKLCAETATPLVPQGGNTGLCGGSVPTASGTEIVLSLSRMNRIRELDALNNTITVEAGCVLANIQQAAAEADRLFPLSLGAEGSCQIGGNLSTNAGGVNVLRYGNARDLVLGLEVVLPDGRIWNGLRALAQGQHRLRPEAAVHRRRRHARHHHRRRAEAVSAAAARRPPPGSRCRDPEARRGTAGHAAARIAATAITAFELISRACLDLVLRAHPRHARSAGGRASMVCADRTRRCRRRRRAARRPRAALAEAMEHGLVSDAVIAGNETQAQALVAACAKSIPEAARAEPGMLYRHDICGRRQPDPRFHPRSAGARSKRAFPAWTHLLRPSWRRQPALQRLRAGPRPQRCGRARRHMTSTESFTTSCNAMGGSFSAEHGIGLFKVAELKRYKSAVELDLMRT